MPGAPVASVIVPCFNYGRFVADALESVQAQSSADWECIVVDDGSTDDTRAVVERFAASDRRIVYVHQSNRGVSAARNAGVARSTGKYLQFLDADDLIQRRKLEQQSAFLDAHPEVDIVYGSARLFSGGASEALEEPWRAAPPRPSGHGGDFLPQLVVRNEVFVSAPLIRRGVIEAVGAFDEDLKGAEDWDFWVRCAIADRRTEYYDAEDTFTLIRHHDVSATTNRRHVHAETIKLRRKLAALLSDPVLNRLNNTRMVEDQVALWAYEALDGNWSAMPRLVGAGARHAKPRWILYGLAVPLARSRRVRAMIAGLRELCRRGASGAGA